MGTQAIAFQPLYSLLSPEDQSFAGRISQEYRLTHSQAQQLITMLRDLAMWQQPSPAISFSPPSDEWKGKDRARAALRQIEEIWLSFKDQGHNYVDRPMDNQSKGNAPRDIHFEEIQDDRNILGSCPVASEKTRCCNLMTLDAVFRCGYDCSYCSIQSFYSQGKISFHGDLAKKLAALNLDPEQFYHIGTGQSSDSLMWGNRNGLLQDLVDFAHQNPNVTLEWKTKSDNVNWVLEQDLPPNILITWSVNTPAMVEQEERYSAPLEKRLEAARKCADAGLAVGFHFHPMVAYRGWQKDYKALFQKVKTLFRPEEVVLVSLGTLTFIKPVLKQIRKRDFQSAILQMPLEEIAGRYSYPFETKLELFQLAMSELAPWKDQVFFYMCMEDKELWEPVFGRSYESNEDFERDMIASYREKMARIFEGRKG